MIIAMVLIPTQYHHALLPPVDPTNISEGALVEGANGGSALWRAFRSGQEAGRECCQCQGGPLPRFPTR
jgi:hypothetical protein